MKITNVTIGADPELFIVDLDENPISAEGLIGGTKNDPIPLTNLGHAVQEDNVMVEFNIPPVIDKASWVRELNLCMELIQAKLGNSLKLVVSSSMRFDKKQLSTEQAMMFGCSPDFTVWSEEMNDTPIPPEEMRYAGGHIHIGYSAPNLTVTNELIKALDLFISIPAVILDDDLERKSFYGTAGRFRFTKYGVEYRTSSNFWLKSQDLQEWVFDQIQLAINFVNNHTLSDSQGERIQNAINTNNEEIAKSIIREYNINIPMVQKIKNEKRVNSMA